MASWTSDLALSRDLLADVNGHVRPSKGNLRDVQAVILAGGRGTRLAPYTSVLPKPLMPIGDRSILEVVVGQLENAGIVNVNFCVGYLAHLIEAVFESRENGHVNITYVREPEALGTAGPLRLVEGLDNTFIVMNGDVLTTIDYEELVAFHREQGNAVTIATRERSIKIDYGLLHLDGESRVREYEEKPTISSRVSMGIYVMEPEVIDLVPKGEYFDFPDLVRVLLEAGEPVGAYDHTGLWFDIGRQEDYERAINVWLEGEEHANGNGNGHANGNGNGAHHVNGATLHGTNGHSRLSRLRRIRAAD
jgi:NDP-sugar pyrophosphorylase family protein